MEAQSTHFTFRELSNPEHVSFVKVQFKIVCIYKNYFLLYAKTSILNLGEKLTKIDTVHAGRGNFNFSVLFLFQYCENMSVWVRLATN